ncbi:rod shape-determining protein RodA, partial [Patescibacteria group bacterium]|nr:rod shape-determining protein RodA [Patescibacteria group bacterium]
AFFLFALIDYRVFRANGALLLLAYALCALLLFMLFFFGARINGAVGWFRIGGFAFQPIEPAKLALALILAKYFSNRHIAIYQLRHLVISGSYAALLIALVFFQPDLGAAIILFGVWIFITIFSGIRIKHFINLVLILALVAGVGWFSVLKPYQKARITAFINPYQDPRGSGYNAIQSLIAVGSGRMFGKGVGYGTQTRLQFLPEPESDFLFAAFAEEWGFAGAIFLLALYGVLFWRMLAIGMHASDNFAKLYVLGFSAIIFLQIFIHIGMNIGILPITGTTLPFLSYGGSSLVTLLAGLGIIESIRIHA